MLLEKYGFRTKDPYCRAGDGNWPDAKPVARDRGHIATYCQAAVLLTLLSHVLSAKSEKSKIERGEYLTHHVAMCVQCHSPRDDRGRLQKNKAFSGGKIPVVAPTWAKSWATDPPNLILLAKERPIRLLSVLQKGKREDGTSPAPPMPPFRLSKDDAQAIVAYLQSLSLE